MSWLPVHILGGKHCCYCASTEHVQKTYFLWAIVWMRSTFKKVVFTPAYIELHKVTSFSQSYKTEAGNAMKVFTNHACFLQHHIFWPLFQPVTKLLKKYLALVWQICHNANHFKIQVFKKTAHRPDLLNANNTSWHTRSCYARTTSWVHLQVKLGSRTHREKGEMWCFLTIQTHCAHFARFKK